MSIIICQCRIITEIQLQEVFCDICRRKGNIDLKDLTEYFEPPKCSGCKRTFQTSIREFPCVR